MCNGTENETMTRDQEFQLYLKVIDYKRSVGITQWAIVAIFTMASGALLGFATKYNDAIAACGLDIAAVIVYLLGILLYGRYRTMNQHVMRYLTDLEKRVGSGFQSTLTANFHSRGPTTYQVLWIVGLVYAIAVVIANRSFF